MAFDEVNCQMAFKNPFTMNLEPLTNNVCLNGINNVPHVIIRDVRTGRQTHTMNHKSFLFKK